MASVTGVQFGFAVSELVEKLAAVSVKESVLYEKRNVKRQSLYDPRFAPIRRDTLCSTCGMPMEVCPGHGGMIPDAGIPFYYPWVLDYILKVLECVCFYCSRLLLPANSLRREYIVNTYQGKTRLRELGKACSEMKYCGAPPKELKFLRAIGLVAAAECNKKGGGGGGGAQKKKKRSRTDPKPHGPNSCGRIQPRYFKMGIAIGATFNLDVLVDQAAPRFNPAVVYRVLANISREDAIALGFEPDVSPIHALMARSIYVPTTHIRFPVSSHDLDKNRGGEDDITIKYNSMLKLRNKLAVAMKKEPTPLRSFHVNYIWTTEDGSEVECKCDKPGPKCTCIIPIPPPPVAQPVQPVAQPVQPVAQPVQPVAQTDFVFKEHRPQVPPGPIVAALPPAGGKSGPGYRRKERKEKTVVDLWNELQTEYVALVTGEYRKIDGTSSGGAAAPATGARNRTQKQSFGLRGIKLRLIGKGGRVRGNLVGKRQDFSARTVISGSLDIDVDEVGVPEHFRSILTKEEIVTRYNQTYLQSLLQKGEISRIRTADGLHEWNCEYINIAAFQLELGYRVDRWLQNGDYVQIGRQPSLHRPSTMVHRVRILPPNIYTFLLNLAVTTPYNADFDGDEMWMVVLQSYAAVMEARILMHVPWQILSPQNARALIGFVQHSVLAAYHLGFRHILLSKEQMMQYGQEARGRDSLPPPAITKYDSKTGKRKEYYTGKQLFSMFLPPSLQFESTAGYKKIVIRNGKWLTGYWTKNAMLQLVYLLVRDFGHYGTSRFISCMQRMLKLFLDDYGATLGPADLRNPCPQRSHALLQKLQTCVDKDENNNSKVVMADEVSMEHTKNTKEYVVEHLLKCLKTARPFYSRLMHVIQSGTKGSHTNLLQLTACLGETMLLGKRIPVPTSHFTLGVTSLASRGFIASSFATGLNPFESYSHFASGREGIVDTGNKTGKVGYLQRKLARMLGDLRVEADGTVRDAENRIVMEVYGDDGFQPSYVESVHIRMSRCKTPQEFEAAYRTPGLDREWHHYLLPLYNSLSPTSSTSLTCPIPFPRLFQFLQTNHKHSDGAKSQVMSKEALFGCLERLFHHICGTSSRSNTLFRAAFWDWLAVKKWPFMPTWQQWSQLEYMICNWYMAQGLIRTGDMVGTLAGQSIAEPAMQMTLRTFYLPGVSSMLLQSGFDMLNDICNATQSATQTTMLVYLKPAYQAYIQEISKKIPGKFLPEVCSKISVETAATSIWRTRCSCMDMTRDLLSKNPGSIRAAPYFLELHLHPEYAVKNKAVVVEQLTKFFGANTCNILHCQSCIRVYLDRFHPLLDKKDCNAKFTFDLIMKHMKEQLCVQGCARIKGAHVQKKDGTILLLGSHTEAIWAMPEVDMRKTMTSDIREVENLFGIDAAALILEDKLITCMKSQGIQLDERHAKLVAANMTRSGRIVPNTGSGVSAESKSTLRKSTFEKMSAQFASEAARGSFDPAKGTIEALILSTVPRMGTNYCDILPPTTIPSIKNKMEIPNKYSMLRDLPSLHMTYQEMKRFMPISHECTPNYTPDNFFFLPALPSSINLSTNNMTPLNLNPIMPRWLSRID